MPYPGAALLKELEDTKGRLKEAYNDLKFLGKQLDNAEQALSQAKAGERHG
jgi:hypothetical protein